MSPAAHPRLIIALALFHIAVIAVANYMVQFTGAIGGYDFTWGMLVYIAVFQRIRARAQSWWAAPLVSTLFANTLDTFIFYSVAFYRSADAFMAANWVELATVDLAFKTVLSVAVFLPAYGVLLNFLQARLTSTSSAAASESSSDSSAASSSAGSIDSPR